MLNVALIGVTGYAKTHLRLLRAQQQIGKLRLVAAVVINPAEAEAEIAALKAEGCAIFDCYEDLLAEWNGRLDLVCIPTAIRWHAPMTVAALRAGANVLVEKPLAGTLQEVEAIQAAEQETGKFVAVGFQDIYGSLTHRVKATLLAGSLGRIVAIKGWGMWPREQSYYTRNSWAGRLRQGQFWVLDSPLNNAMAHFLNLMLFLLGEGRERSARPVSVQGELYRSKPIESFDTAGLRLQFAEQRSLLFLATHSAQANRDPEIWIEGEKATLRWNFWKSCVIHYNDGSEQLLTVPAQEVVLTEMMQAVLQKIERPDTFVCSTDIARMHTLVINALHDHCVIQTVDSALVEEVRTENSSIFSLRGIEGDFAAAFLAGKLPSEHNLPWARKSVPPEIGIQTYNSFNNCGFC